MDIIIYKLINKVDDLFKKWQEFSHLKKFASVLILFIGLVIISKLF